MADGGTVVLEAAVDGRVVEALAEQGVQKLDSDALEFADDTDSDIDYVRLFSE